MKSSGQSQTAFLGQYALPRQPLLLMHDIVEGGDDTEDPASWRTCIHNASLLLDAARASAWHVVHIYGSKAAPIPISVVRPWPEEAIFQYTDPSALPLSGLKFLLARDTPLEILLTGRSLLPMCLAIADLSADLGLTYRVVSDAISLSKYSQTHHFERSVEATLSRSLAIATTTTTAHLLKISGTLNLLDEAGYS